MRFEMTWSLVGMISVLALVGIVVLLVAMVIIDMAINSHLDRKIKSAEAKGGETSERERLG